MDKLCPCGASTPYQSCCGPLHLGTQLAQSPEQLMRSRYCAFVIADEHYIYATHSLATRHSISIDSIKQWNQQCQWLGLDIRHTSRQEGEGIVEFIAWYKQAGQLNYHCERSRFTIENIEDSLAQRLKKPQQATAWYYLDASYPDKPIALPQRNDPCICHSDKKYKKCCGK